MASRRIFRLMVGRTIRLVRTTTPPPSASASTTRSDKKRKAAKAGRKPNTAPNSPRKPPSGGFLRSHPHPTLTRPPSPLKGEGISCHAELVSASRIFYKQRQADKWNNEILKQVQDDIFFLSSFRSLTRESGQTTAPVIASGAKQSSLSPAHIITSGAKQSGQTIFP